MLADKQPLAGQVYQKLPGEKGDALKTQNLYYFPPLDNNPCLGNLLRRHFGNQDTFDSDCYWCYDTYLENKDAERIIRRPSPEASFVPHEFSITVTKPFVVKYNPTHPELDEGNGGDK